MFDYDVLIIGSGPAGEKAAIQAAKLGGKVGIVEIKERVGGVCIHTGTLPSKTLRETVIYISNLKSRSLYGVRCELNQNLTISELMYRKNIVITKDEEVVRDNLYRNNIDVYTGYAKFVDEHTLEVQIIKGTRLEFTASFIVICSGSRPDRPGNIPFDDDNIYDSSSILDLDRVPKSMIIIGGGVIGCEYATIFAHLGIRVDIVDSRHRLLKFLDLEFSDSLAYQMRKSGITLHLGQEVKDVKVIDEHNVVVTLNSGKTLTTEKLLYAKGRVANVDSLGLDGINLTTDKRGFLKVNENFQTDIPHIYAAGDVIGFPSLASTSMDQGRLAMNHAFKGETGADMNRLLPFGIWTIPEISIVGETEQSLTEKKIDYEVGRAYYNEIARGLIIGDYEGMLKLLIDRETLKILGVHIIGDKAAELIHVGQAVMSMGGSVNYFIDTVFNFPTLTDAYKVAALNGYNKILETNSALKSSGKNS